MSTMPFDTLKLAHVLHDDAKMSTEQAEGISSALAEAFRGKIATKADIRELETELRTGLRDIERRLTLRIGAMIGSATTLLLVAILLKH